LPSKTRVVLVAWYVAVFVVGFANIGMFPIQYLSQAPQPTQPIWITLHYPQESGAGQYLGNASSREYITVEILLTPNSTIVQNDPVNMISYGCVSPAFAKGLDTVSVVFPGAQGQVPTDQYLINGGGGWGVNLVPSLNGAIYCNPYIPPMTFLNSTTTVIQWPNSGDYNAVMTAQYSNGTTKVVTGINLVHVASAMDLSTSWWTRTGGIAALMTLLVGVPEYVYKKQ
jgi:hypothetical protein